MTSGPSLLDPAGLQAATGIPSTTVARLLTEGRHGARLAPWAVVVIDETSTVGTRHLAAVSDLVEQTAEKLILRSRKHEDAGDLGWLLGDSVAMVERFACEMGTVSRAPSRVLGDEQDV
jgi:hypothetical protein